MPAVLFCWLGREAMNWSMLALYRSQRTTGLE
jgi:hypothetical protein